MANEVDRTRATLLQDVETLRQWLFMQPHLPHEIDDEFLLAFVCGTKSLEIAKQKLDSFYSIRNKHPVLLDFSIRDPLSSKFREAASAVRYCLLPQVPKEGYSISFFGINPENLSKFDHQLLDMRLEMGIELGMKLYPEMRNLIVVVDMKGVNSSILSVVNVHQNFFMIMFQNIMPIKFKKGIYFNVPSFMSSVINFFLSFLNEKINKRLIITSRDKDILEEHLPLECLPSDYGGKNKSLEELSESFYEVFVQNRDWLEKNAALHSDESKRPPNTNSSFGVEGTFRTLAFD